MRTKKLLQAAFLFFCVSCFAHIARAQQDIYADSLVASSTDFQNPKFCVDNSHTSYAYTSRILTLLSNSNLVVRFPQAGQAGDIVNFVVQTTGNILTANALNGISVKLYDDAGNLVETDSGSAVLKLSVLSAGTNRYAIRAFSNLTANYNIRTARIDFANLLTANLINEFRVFDVFIQRPCDPSVADGVYAAGSSQSVNLLSGYTLNASNAVDANDTNKATLTVPLNALNLLPPAYIDLKFSNAGNSGNFVGFTVGGTGSGITVAVLSQLKIDVYDVNNVLRESKSNFSIADLKLLTGTTNKYVLGFTTQYGNYKIGRARLTLGGVVNLLSSIYVYNAFQYNALTPLTVINTSGPTTFCQGDSVILTAYDTLGNAYIWNTGATTKSITVKTSGSYYVTVIDTVNCDRRSITIDVNVVPSLSVKIIGDTCFTPSQTSGVLRVQSGYPNYLWSTGATTDYINITSRGTYWCAVTLNANCKGSDTVAVGDCGEVQIGDSIIVHDFISPNGDGDNDSWIIQGLHKFPKSEVYVFDKWGDVVFERRGYSNSDGWKGLRKGSSESEVPNGTYYYVIKLNAANPGGKTEYTGFIMIQR